LLYFFPKSNTIDHYIPIDKVGNLISVDSPEPGDPKLKALIEEWIKNKSRLNLELFDSSRLNIFFPIFFLDTFVSQ